MPSGQQVSRPEDRMDYVVEHPVEEGLPEAVRILDNDDIPIYVFSDEEELSIGDREDLPPLPDDDDSLKGEYFPSLPHDDDDSEEEDEEEVSESLEWDDSEDGGDGSDEDSEDSGYGTMEEAVEDEER